jgi:hypothetical protein
LIALSIELDHRHPYTVKNIKKKWEKCKEKINDRSVQAMGEGEFRIFA